jgi:hypothetical protein
MRAAIFPTSTMTSYCTYTRLLLVLFVCACHEKSANDPTIELAIDDVVRTTPIHDTILLSSLVSDPPASWSNVRAVSADGRWLEIPTPTTTYPDGQIRIYVERKRVAIGVFTGERMLAQLAPVTRVDVSTHETLPETLPPLVIVVGGVDNAIASDALRALHDKPRRGWALIDVIRIATPDAKRVTIEGAVFDDISNVTLKLNRGGSYVARVWDNEGQAPTREIRNVTKIVVE